VPQEPSNSEIDVLILGCAQPGWVKVEAVIVRVGALCEKQNLRFDPDVIASRIVALAYEGSLDGIGDLSRWRHGEVRLPREIDPS
jgi:hypothetical protein